MTSQLFGAKRNDAGLFVFLVMLAIIANVI